MNSLDSYWDISIDSLINSSKEVCEFKVLAPNITCALMAKKNHY